MAQRPIRFQYYLARYELATNPMRNENTRSQQINQGLEYTGLYTIRGHITPRPEHHMDKQMEVRAIEGQCKLFRAK